MINLDGEVPLAAQRSPQRKLGPSEEGVGPEMEGRQRAWDEEREAIKRSARE